MAEEDFASLASLHQLGDEAIPLAVLGAAGSDEVGLVWRNDLGGLTFSAPGRFIKWNPRTTGIDLARERVRLEWISARHPAPRVLDWWEDEVAQLMVTAAMPGDCAVGDVWRARRAEAIAAIATGLRAMHDLSVDDVPPAWVADSWVARRPASLGAAPPIDGPVLVHGDACAPNTLIDDDGKWVGHVDLGDLSVGDRWADLAIASLSLDWNFGAGHQGEFFDAYGIDPDAERIDYYRRLWHLAS